jgi:hypothetical protein
VHATSLDLLGKQLNALAEVYDKKVVTPKALEVWFDTLREFPTEKVMDKLIHWPKTHGRFPVPAEVWKDLNDVSIDHREASAIAEKGRYAQEERYMGKTEQGAAIIRGMHAAIADKSAFTGAKLARRMLERGSLSLLQLDFVRANLPREELVEREPGQDEEELSA